MTNNEIKTVLLNSSKEEIVRLLLDLYSLSKSNKEYMRNSLTAVDQKSLLKKYIKIITDEFYPQKGDPKLRHSLIRNSIKEFTSLSKNKEDIAILLLHYAETGVKFTNDFGDMDEQYYDRISFAYKQALSYIFKYKFEKKFREKCINILINTNDIGWGFHDYMSDLFYAFYEEEFDSDFPGSI
jgi:hypothetical protein